MKSRAALDGLTCGRTGKRRRDRWMTGGAAQLGKRRNREENEMRAILVVFGLIDGDDPGRSVIGGPNHGP